MSIADMLNVARGAQAYQQAQQLNPLALQQQQYQTELAKRTLEPSVQAKELEAQLLKETFNPKVEKAKSEATQAQTEAKRSQFALDKSHFDVANGVLTGLSSRLDAHVANKDPATALKEAEETEKYLQKAFDFPKKEGGPMDMYKEMIKKGDLEGAKAFLSNLTSSMASSQAQYEANLPSFERNAAGNIVQTNRAKGTVGQPATTGQVNPSTQGVSNFGEYQKDLTNRVAAGTQIDSRLNEVEDLMSKFKPGAGARTYADIARKLQAVGAPQDLVDKIAGGDLSAAQSFNKFMAQIVTQGVAQASGGGSTANIMNEYVKNNPDISTDPRALQRFIDFAHKQNNMSYEEQQILLDKIKNKQFNPDTHVIEAQQHILDKFVKPKSSGQQTSNVPKSSDHGDPIAKATKNGVTYYKYADGYIGTK
jgi:hypothetical protein